jgi:hypothetical protein
MVLIHLSTPATALPAYCMERTMFWAFFKPKIQKNYYLLSVDFYFYIGPSYSANSINLLEYASSSILGLTCFRSLINLPSVLSGKMVIRN